MVQTETSAITEHPKTEAVEREAGDGSTVEAGLTLGGEGVEGGGEDVHTGVIRSSETARQLSHSGGQSMARVSGFVRHHRGSEFTVGTASSRFSWFLCLYLRQQKQLKHLVSVWDDAKRHSSYAVL